MVLPDQPPLPCAQFFPLRASPILPPLAHLTSDFWTLPSPTHPPARASHLHLPILQFSHYCPYRTTAPILFSLQQFFYLYPYSSSLCTRTRSLWDAFPSPTHRYSLRSSNILSLPLSPLLLFVSSSAPHPLFSVLTHFLCTFFPPDYSHNPICLLALYKTSKGISSIPAAAWLQEA